ncbi:MAG: hypothetical protein LBJ47_04515 [Tannerella sp.]|nr:hypothetical protein [Tannerella sp.]
MKDEAVYYERQRFRQWWVIALMAGTDILFIAGCVRQLILGMPFGNNPMSDTGLIVVSATILASTVLFLSLTLNTVINEDGIRVWFHPVQFRKKYFSWEEIARVYIRKYRPITEYGGWEAYNMSGNMGLQIVLTNGKEFLIGTNNPDGLSEMLKKAGKMD